MTIKKITHTGEKIISTKVNREIDLYCVEDEKYENYEDARIRERQLELFSKMNEFSINGKDYEIYQLDRKEDLDIIMSKVQEIQVQEPYNKKPKITMSIFKPRKTILIVNKNEISENLIFPCKVLFSIKINDVGAGYKYYLENFNEVMNMFKKIIE